MSSYSVYPLIENENENVIEDDDAGNVDSLSWPAPLLTQTVMSGITMELFHIEARDLIRSVSDWSFNRQVDQPHVQELKTALLKHKYPYFIGTFKVVKDSSGMKILDAQHRIAAIREICEADIDMAWTIKVVVERFTIDSTESMECVELLKMANNNRQFNPNEFPEIHIVCLMNVIMEDPLLSRGVVDFLIQR